MTISMGLAAPARISGGARQEAREARRRQHVIRFIMLAAAGRAAVDRRTLAGIITLAIGLAAAKGLSSDRGDPRPGLVPGTRARQEPQFGIAAPALLAPELVNPIIRHAAPDQLGGDRIWCDRAQSTPNWDEEELLNWPFTIYRGRREDRTGFASR